MGNAALAEEAMRQHLLGVGVDLISEPTIQTDGADRLSGVK
jgi:hypothetical protein